MIRLKSEKKSQEIMILLNDLDDLLFFLRDISLLKIPYVCTKMYHAFNNRLVPLVNKLLESDTMVEFDFPFIQK